MTDEYLDEVILRAKKERKENQYVKEIMEKGFPEEFFQTVHIREDLAEISIPYFFQDMPQEWIDRKYTYEPQPQIIKTSKDKTVDFTCSVLDVTMKDEELKQNVTTVKQGMQRMLSTIIFLDEGQEEINGILVCWFSYIQNLRDGAKVYNMVFYASMEKIVMFTINCNYAFYKNWDAIGKYCIRTLKGRT